MSKDLLNMRVYENYSKMIIHTDKADILESTKETKVYFVLPVSFLCSTSSW